VSEDSGEPGRPREDFGTVRIVGTGLLGTSIGLALGGGPKVLLDDPSPTALALARDVGAGVVDDGGASPDLVVVAAPPDVTAKVVAEQLHTHPDATVTDVASVKLGVVEQLASRGVDLRRYVGGHPMAGRERSGPVASRADLFMGRPWVICPAPETESERVEQVRRLVTGLGAAAVTMGPAEHDAAVALVSHVPQVAASLVAARLTRAPDPAVSLAGQGVRDVTRIAGSDPTLWAQILSANAGPVAAVLRELRADLDDVIEALAALGEETSGPRSWPAREAVGARGTLARLVAAGNDGRDRIPGKHGAAPTTYAVVTALLPDSPGQLARLFSDIGDAGINVEEFSLEHAPGMPVGLAEVSVLPAVRGALEEALVTRGWHVV
jgi:prephenate dehydrogenase